MNEQKNTQNPAPKPPQTGGTTPQRDGQTGGQKSPNQQRPPTDNDRRSGPEQSEKEHRSNLAGDQDTDEAVETEEG
jgi:hypothetical protein